MKSKGFNSKHQLEKHGWKSGGGLGKNGHGMRNAIKVNMKMDKTGIGHDPGAEFKNDWWNHMFNAAANCIKVTSDKDGAPQITKVGDFQLTMKKEMNLANKKLLYGRFVKSATLQDGLEVKEGGLSSDSDSDSDDETDKRTLTISGTYSETSVKEKSNLKQKRTMAHDPNRAAAAANGDRLSSELSENKQPDINEPEPSTTISLDPPQELTSKERKRLRKLKREEEVNHKEEDVDMNGVVVGGNDVDLDHSVVDNEQYVTDSVELVSETLSEKTKRNKRRKREVELPDEVIEIDVSETVSTEKKKKKKKRKDKEDTSVTFLEDHEQEQSENKLNVETVDVDCCEIISDNEVVSSKQKKKKRRKHDRSLPVEDDVNNVDICVEQPVSAVDNNEPVVVVVEEKRSKRKRDMTCKDTGSNDQCDLVDGITDVVELQELGAETNEVEELKSEKKRKRKKVIDCSLSLSEVCTAVLEEGEGERKKKKKRLVGTE